MNQFVLTLAPALKKLSYKVRPESKPNFISPSLEKLQWVYMGCYALCYQL